MPDRSNREQEIFNGTLELPGPRERAAYLDSACGSDAALRASVEGLLRAYDEAGGFLAESAEPETKLTVPLKEKPGDRIGRYKLLQKIGEGGCGVVYMAEQEEPVRRRVALKVIKLGMDTRSVIARFEAERQALAMKEHPNIAKVLDAGATESGRPFFVMELVRGLKITEYCDQNALSTTERLKLFIQVCHAIQHAHQKGVIHRDIKPSNVLVTVNDGVPVPKVIDFGIAKATNEQRLTDKTLFTAFEQFIGTPAYMSPEQATMTSLDIDTRSDIYSLGVLLYELLTGRTPFDPTTLLQAGLDEMRRIIREQEPPKPSTRLTEELVSKSAIRNPKSEIDGASSSRLLRIKELIHLLRGDLDWIVMKCLEKDRARRYETANGLAMDIQRHLNSEPVTARSPSAAYRFRKLVRRNKLVFAAAAAVTLALLLGIVVSTWQAVRAKRAESKARTAEKTAVENSQVAQEQRQRAEDQTQTARQNLYVADMNVAQHSLEMNNLGRIVELLDRHRPKDGETDLRGWEWRYLWKLCQSDALFTLYEHSNSIYGLAISVDGLFAALGDYDGIVKVVDIPGRRVVATLQEIQRRDIQTDAALVEFSPQGALLAFSGTKGVTLCETRFWQKVAELRNPGIITSLAFSPDGKLLATYAVVLSQGITPVGSTVRIWDIEKKTQIGSFTGSRPVGGQNNKLAFAPDGRTLAIGETDGRIRLVTVSTGTEKASWRAHTDGVSALAFSPDGKTLASGAAYSDPWIRLWNVEDGKEVGAYNTHKGWIGSVAFSPNSELLASSSADQSIRLWDVAQRRELRTLRGHLSEVWRIAFFPDGKRLLSGCKDGSVKVWSAVPKPSQESFAFLPTNIDAQSLYFVQNCVFLPDGRTMATVSQEDGSIALWDVSAVERREKLLALGTNNSGIAVSPDAKLFAFGCTNEVKVWNLTEKEEVTRLPGAGVPIAFHSGDKTLVTSDGFSVQVWDTGSWRGRLGCRFGQAFDTIACSPDNRTVATGDLVGGVTVWNLENGKKEAALRVDGSLTRAVVAFSPDGRLLAAGNESGTAKLWKNSSWEELAPPLRGHLQGIHAIAFSPDGRRLATGGTSATEAVKLWDVATHQELATLQGSGSAFLRIAFSPDGNTIMAVPLSGKIHLWRAPSFEEIDSAVKVEAKR